MEPTARQGTLFLVSTPIGHLEDITLRALRVLKEVDVVAAEDTRHTQKLLTRYDIHKTLTSYHDFNKEAKAPLLLTRMLEGAWVALVCDAGTPTISDPGYFLISRCIEARVPVVPIPGPCAAIAALAVSGLPTDRFHFEGFLPKPSGRLAKRLAVLREYPETLVLYESPHRLLKTLKAVYAAWGDRPAVIAREMTKLHEECLRGMLSAVITDVERRPRRGEITILVGGCAQRQAPESIESVDSGARDETDPTSVMFRGADR